MKYIIYKLISKIYNDDHGDYHEIFNCLSL